MGLSRQMFCPKPRLMVLRVGLAFWMEKVGYIELLELQAG